MRERAVSRTWTKFETEAPMMRSQRLSRTQERRRSQNPTTDCDLGLALLEEEEQADRRQHGRQEADKKNCDQAEGAVRGEGKELGGDRAWAWVGLRSPAMAYPEPWLDEQARRPGAEEH